MAIDTLPAEIKLLLLSTAVTLDYSPPPLPPNDHFEPPPETFDICSLFSLARTTPAFSAIFKANASTLLSQWLSHHLSSPDITATEFALCLTVAEAYDKFQYDHLDRSIFEEFAARRAFMASHDADAHSFERLANLLIDPKYPLALVEAACDNHAESFLAFRNVIEGYPYYKLTLGPMSRVREVGLAVLTFSLVAHLGLTHSFDYDHEEEDIRRLMKQKNTMASIMSFISWRHKEQLLFDCREAFTNEVEKWGQTLGRELGKDLEDFSESVRKAIWDGLKKLVPDIRLELLSWMMVGEG